MRALAPRAMAWIALTAFFFACHAFWQGGGAARRLSDRIPPHGCVLRAVGVVAEEPVPDFRFRLRLESIAYSDGPLEPCAAQILVTWPGEPPRLGDRVELIGSARNLKPAQNPGGFDSATQRRRQGIFSEIRVRYPGDAKIVAHNQGNPVRLLASRLRQALERTISLGLEDSPTEAALIRCMVLGSPTDESMQEIADQFQYTGAVHLYAVTGMNVVVLLALATALFRAFDVPRPLIFLTLLPIIWLYAFATGLGASTLRAAAMISVFLVGSLIDRPALTWNSLGLATVAVLLCSPGQLFRHGFVFSFLIVAVMMAATNLLREPLERIGPPDPFLPRQLWTRRIIAWDWSRKKIADWIATGVTAWIASIPLMLFYFHLWSPSTVPANLLGGVLAFAVIGVGIFSAVAGMFWPWLAITLNNTNWLLAKALLWVISAFCSMPGGYAFVETPSPRPPLCEVETLDLPGGGAIHIRTRGHPAAWNYPGWGRRDWLVDCGSAPAFPRIVLPYLHSRGVNRLDGLVVTHGDSKHIGGAGGVLKAFAPVEVVDSALRDRSSHRKALHALLAANRTGKSIVRRGDVITLSPGITLNVLFPPDGYDARSSDDKALVLRLDIAGPREKGRSSVLFMSDAGFITEHWLLEHASGEELQCTVLVKGMHGKDLSGTPEFLEAVRPATIVASSTDFPPNERVRDDWATMVKQHKLRLLRQDETGAVRIALDRNGQWEITPFQKACPCPSEADNLTVPISTARWGRSVSIARWTRSVLTAGWDPTANSQSSP